MRFKRAGFLTKLVVLALLIYMATTLLNVRSEIQEMRRERDQLENQVAMAQLQNQELADAIEHSSDPEVLERVARNKGFVREGEELYIDVAN